MISRDINNIDPEALIISILEEHMRNRIVTGCNVLLHDYKYDEQISYHIVDSHKADILENKISEVSPLGKALIGRKCGDEIEIDAPDGKEKYKILSWSR
ncbi:GreA/GreB family elongation factor [Alkalithermobacter paradoxus]|uniref:Transcription inhibitor protein Gfh1 n=1 Tax=Alkalithermobacter paradoxus TaxID=29349 RepID=A0A1V4IC06_9FIRM|nr:transcription inhibitor protein Gfh1 [[Clostridium] thermoalcaliphilum]